MNSQILEGKRILMVDDEPDILNTVVEVLSSSQVVTAQSFDEARALIGSESFDLVILDIMGVNGFALLEACRANKLPAAMLTAHAVNVESLNLAVKLGAVSFLPKEELHRLPELVAEILEGLEQGQTHWAKLFKRLGPFFKDKLGVLWEDEKSKFPPNYY
ncbi:MAG: response regulator [Desulfomonile tiedjei]|nr:response regulator [Desulfomonile tiedjei]